MRGGGTLVVKAEDLTIKSIERSEVEERVRVENEVIHFDDYDEYATYTLTLENPTSTKLQVTNINLTNNECVTLDTSNLENTIVEPNSTKEVTITLTSDKCNVNQDNTALLSFKSKEYTEAKTEEKEDIVSPNTYGNISIFLVVLFLLTAIYISLYIYSKKKPFKYLKLSTIIYLALLITTTITYTIMTSFSANEESLSLTFSYTYKPRRVLMRRNYDYAFDGSLDWAIEDEGTFWENMEAKNIYIRNEIEEPSSYEEVYDASMNQDESILIYKVINQDDDNYYDLYMMADGEIFTNVDSGFLFASFMNLTELNGLENINTFLTSNFGDMFSDNGNLERLDVTSLITKNAINMSEMFGWMYSLEENLDLSHFDTSNVTNMSFMFGDDTAIKAVGIENFNTSKVTDMRYLFYNYESNYPLDLSHLDTSKVTNMEGMFSGYRSSAPLDLSNFDTSNVTNMSYMFSSYRSNQPLDLSSFDTSNVTDMSGMFYEYSSSAPLDLSLFDTSNVTNMSHMFESYRSSALLNITCFNTSNVTNMKRMFGIFRGRVTGIEMLNTSNVTDMSEMFYSYDSGEILDLSNYNFSRVLNIYGLLSQYNSTFPIDLSSLNVAELEKNTYMIYLNNQNVKVYVANENMKNLLVSKGWHNITSNNVIVGSCEEGVCHSN